MEQLIAGQADADLGSGIFKQRVARAGGGKSGGFRTLIVFRLGATAFFIHGFAKNALDNVTADDMKEMKRLAKVYLGFNAAQLDEAVREQKLVEVKYI